MVIAWIQQSILSSISKSVLWIDIVVGVWKNICIWFWDSGIFAYQIFKMIFIDFAKVLLMSLINSLIWKFMGWTRKSLTSLFRKCLFSCTRGVVNSIKIYMEQNYVIRFLRGLNGCFSYSKSQIMMTNPFSDIDIAFLVEIQIRMWNG